MIAMRLQNLLRSVKQNECVCLDGDLVKIDDELWRSRNVAYIEESSTDSYGLSPPIFLLLQEVTWYVVEDGSK